MFESPGRVAFSIFGFDVMWYGICVASGILAGFLLIYMRAERHHGISKDRAFNFVILIVIAALIGTRLYYVAFNWEYYSKEPLSILDFRSGGLAIHGGLLAGMLMVAFLCWRCKENFLNFADMCFTVIPLGQAIGRWGNFFNSEVYGYPTDVPWALIVDGAPVHPTFLYESVWCFILFWVLMRVDGRRQFFGQTLFLYWILYSAERFVVEGMRTDNLIAHLPFGDLRQAQIVSAAAIIVCAVLYAVCYRAAKAKGFPQVNAVYAPPIQGGSEPTPETHDNATEAARTEAEE